MAHFVLLTRDAGAWIVGPFPSAEAANRWGRETYCTPRDDPRWQTVILDNPAAPLPVIAPAAPLPEALAPYATMEPSFPQRVAAALEAAREGDTIVVAVVGPGGALAMHTRSDRPQDLAQVAASLAEECAERLDMAGDVLDGAEAAALLVAAQDAGALLREALGDD